MSTEETTTVQVIPADKDKIKHIWKVAGILAAITTLEFIVALAIPFGPMLKLIIFVAMTIVKAAYIVGEFMHLKHEKKALMWSILLPMLFVVFMIFIFRYESGAILNARGW